MRGRAFRVIAWAVVPIGWVWSGFGGVTEAVLFAAAIALVPPSVCLGWTILVSASVAVADPILHAGELVPADLGRWVLPAAVAGALLDSGARALLRQPASAPLPWARPWLRACIRTAAAVVAVVAAAATLDREVPLERAGSWAVLFAWLTWRLRTGPRQDATAASILRTGALTAALVVTSTVVSLGGLELGARLLLPEPPDMLGIYARHPEYVFLLAPNGRGHHRIALPEGKSKRIDFATSSQGLRDVEYSDKAPGEYRIAMLGDSFTMGHTTAPADSIPKQLEVRLREASPGREVRVLNCGLGGAGPLQELGMLRERALPLEPDAVILQIFPMNDIGNALESAGKHLRAYAPLWLEAVDVYRYGDRLAYRLDTALRRRSHAYRALCLATSRRWIVRAGNRCRLLTPPTAKRPPSVNRPYVLEADLAEGYPELDEAFSLFQRCVLEIRDECRVRGIPFMAYCIPGIPQIFDDRWQAVLQEIPSPDLYDRGKSLRMTEEFLLREGIPFVSVLEPLRACGGVRETHYLEDGHLSERGNGVVAEVLAEYVLASDEFFPPFDSPPSVKE